MYKVESINGSTKPASEFLDYVPDFRPIKFKHQQSEQIVQIKLVNEMVDNYVKKTDDAVKAINDDGDDNEPDIKEF
jgi:hypothetical protein